MKFYSEREMKSLRLELEKRVLQWPQVSTKKMFGCPCYQADRRIFVFLVTDGIVITQISQADRETLSRQHQTSFFQAGKKIIQSWLKVFIKNKAELDQIMPFIRKSYESALILTSAK